MNKRPAKLAGLRASSFVRPFCNPHLRTRRCLGLGTLLCLGAVTIHAQTLTSPVSPTQPLMNPARAMGLRPVNRLPRILNLLQDFAGPLDGMQPRAAVVANERLAALLDRPQGCANNALIDLRGPLNIGQVASAVLCQQAGVLRGTGLAAQAQAALGQALAQGQPALSLSAGLDARSRAATSWEASARLDWVLFDFGSRDAGLRQARLALAAVLDEQRVEVLTALGEAAQLFAAAQAAHGRMDAAEVNLRSAQESARVADARHAAGAGTLGEKLQAQTAQAQAQFDQSRATSQWQSAAGSLSVAMGLPAQESVTFTPTEAPSDEAAANNIDLNALIDEARQRHPRVSAARARLAEARARVEAVTAERWGNLGLNASTGRTRSSSEADARGSSSVGLQWTLPLFDRGAQSGRRGDALGQIMVREVDVGEALKQVELQVWQQGQALIGERDGLRHSRAVLDSADASLRVATERYRRGVGNFNDVLVPQNVAANARFQWVEAQANLRRAQLRLAASVGRFGPLLLR